MNSYLFAWLLAVILGALVLGAFFGKSKRLIAAVPHNAAWATSFLVYGTGLLNHYHLGPAAWGMVLTSIGIFNVVIYALVPAGDQGGRVRLREVKPLATPKQYLLLSLMFYIGWFIYLLVIARQFGLSVLVDDPLTIRAAEDSYLAQVPFFARALMYLGPVVLVLSLFPELVQRSMPASLRWVNISLIILALLSLLQRTNLFLALLWAGSYLLLKVGFGLRGRRDDASGAEVGDAKLKQRAIASALLFVVIGAVAFQVLGSALGKTGTTNRAVYSVVDPALQDSELIGALGYASNGLAAFGVLVESRNEAWPPVSANTSIYGDYNPQTWGLATAGEFGRFVDSENRWRKISPFVYTPMPTNVYTWLEPWYRDFRLVGVISGTLVVATLVSLMLRGACYGSSTRLVVGAALVGVTGLAGFVNQLLSTQALVGIGAVLALGAFNRVTARTKR